MKVYYAAPLFSEPEQRYNAYAAQTIRAVSETIDLYVPQEQTDINDKSKYADSVMIAKVDTEKVLESDLMIAVLAGLSIDPGVAAEIGIAYAKKSPYWRFTRMCARKEPTCRKNSRHCKCSLNHNFPM